MKDEKRAPQPHAFLLHTSSFIIHTSTAGHRDNPPLLLLHQTASSGVMFARVMELLADDYSLIAPDLPGFGRSAPLPHPPTMADYAAAVAGVLDALGIARCDVFGHHTGAAVAVQLATQHATRIRRLILSGPPLLTPAQIAHLEATLIPFEPTAAYVQAIWERTARKSPGMAADLLYREVVLTLSAGPALADAYRAVFAHDFGGQLAALTQPVLLLAGEHDSLVDSLAPSYRLVQRGQMRRIPGAGTFICDEQPELVAALLREWVGSAESPPTDKTAATPG